MTRATVTAEAPTTARPRRRPAVAAPRSLGERGYRLAVAACLGAVATFLALRLSAWPPHEDETLALFVGHGSLGSLLDTVLGERGGAPLHFLAAWIVAHAGGGITELRLVSAAFALASIPACAALARRLGGHAVAAVATVLLSASWVLLFHGVYARMYSLFLFTSTLSYLALLAALRAGGARAWSVWAATVLLAVATHPYGALVLASQAVFVLLARDRLREAVLAFGAVGVLGIPFWITDLVLAGRFEVGLGGGEGRLGGPVDVLAYLGDVAADFSAGPIVLPVTLALAAAGLRELRRTNPCAALLVAAVFATPTLAFLLARMGRSAAPETRHLIFALPFFATILAASLVAVARSGRPGAARVASLTAALLVAGAVGWAWQKTPPLFVGETEERRQGREAASAWLAADARPDDVLLGYEPTYLRAWERTERFSRLVLPRADARLAAETLRRAPRPLGRGIWVLNAADSTNPAQDTSIPLRLPRPSAPFEARAFGPFLVVRSREPTVTPAEYLRQAAAVMVLAKTLAIGDAGVNFETVARAADALRYESSSRSRSTSSR